MRYLIQLVDVLLDMLRHLFDEGRVVSFRKSSAFEVQKGEVDPHHSDLLSAKLVSNDIPHELLPVLSLSKDLHLLFELLREFKRFLCLVLVIFAILLFELIDLLSDQVLLDV